MANKTFLRQNSKLLKKLGHKWRRPRGRQSKMREHRAGKAPLVNIGYGTRDATRNLHPSGLTEIIVSTPSQLSGVTKENAVRIASSVGTKKRLLIVAEAKKMGVKILNANEVKLRTVANAHTKKKQKKTETKPESKETKPKKEAKKEVA